MFSAKEMLMLKKLWLGSGVKSDAGVSIKFKGLHNIEYLEGGKLLIAFRERLVGEPRMDVDSSSIEKWEPPFDIEMLSARESAKLLIA